MSAKTPLRYPYPEDLGPNNNAEDEMDRENAEWERMHRGTHAAWEWDNFWNGYRAEDIYPGIGLPKYDLPRGPLRWRISTRRTRHLAEQRAQQEAFNELNAVTRRNRESGRLQALNQNDERAAEMEMANMCGPYGCIARTRKTIQSVPRYLMNTMRRLRGAPAPTNTIPVRENRGFRPRAKSEGGSRKRKRAPPPPAEAEAEAEAEVEAAAAEAVPARPRIFTGILQENRPESLKSPSTGLEYGINYSNEEALKKSLPVPYSHARTVYKNGRWPNISRQGGPKTNENQKNDPEYAAYFAYRKKHAPRYPPGLYGGKGRTRRNRRRS